MAGRDLVEDERDSIQRHIQDQESEDALLEQLKMATVKWINWMSRRARIAALSGS